MSPGALYYTAIALVCVSSLVAFLFRSLQFLRFFQQEEYDDERFIRWVILHRAFDRRLTIVATLAALSCWLSPIYAQPLISAFAGLLVMVLVRREPDPTKSGKKRLEMTERASRIRTVAVLVVFILMATVGYMVSHHQGRHGVTTLWLVTVAIVQTHPLWLVVSNLILSPFEKYRQSRYLREARERLTEIRPIVIGITGSYGKTSTKSILAQLLDQSLGPTFYPPRSVNTPMGICREIRTHLDKKHKYAVIEMAAYGVGSIRRLCQLTPPSAAIITNVGIMHLERFGSRENVYVAKSELPAALPSNGILICNADNEGALRMAMESKTTRTLLFGLGLSSAVDCQITNMTVDEAGTKFSLLHKGMEYHVRTPLLGLPAVYNVAAAFTMACALGAEPNYIVALIANLAPEKGRLELSRVEDCLWINDGYNSNPSGFRAALDVLRQLGGDRKILMTPGMVELGTSQYTENYQIAIVAAAHCDEIIVIGTTNRDAWLKGLDEAKFDPDKTHVLSSREEAFAWIKSTQSPKDVVLIENDLPDLYETKISL